MTIVDASVWISSITPTEIHHHESVAWLRVHFDAGGRIGAPAHFPAEVTGAMRRASPRSQSIAPLIETIFSSELIDIYPIGTDLARMAAEIGGALGLRGADSIYVALAAWLGLPLVTWDRQQRERGARFCRTLTPVEAVAAG